MQLNKSILAAAAAAVTAFSAMPGAAMAETVSFTVDASFAGGSVNGFTFSDNWRNYGNDARNAPFMEWYDQTHSIVYDAGTFDFSSMLLGGSPWNDYYYNYGGQSSNTLTINFLGAQGQLIETDTLLLPADNEFYAFAKDVAGVHEITFQHFGFWPRLDSITLNAAAVPEPESYAMALGGLMVLGAWAARQRKAAATRA